MYVCVSGRVDLSFCLDFYVLQTEYGDVSRGGSVLGKAEIIMIRENVIEGVPTTACIVLIKGMGVMHILLLLNQLLVGIEAEICLAQSLRRHSGLPLGIW